MPPHKAFPSSYVRFCVGVGLLALSLGTAAAQPTPLPMPRQTPLPPPPPPPAAIVTEWVWLLAHYVEEHEALARAITQKYREPLSLPPDTSIAPEQWLVLNPPINPETLNERRACVEAAQQEFRSLKEQLDKLFMEAFANWAKVAYTTTAEGATATWQAVADLRSLRLRWFGSDRPGEKVLQLQKLFAEEISKFIEERIKDSGKRLITKMDKQVARHLVDEKSLPSFVRDQLKAKLKLPVPSLSELEQGLREGLINIQRLHDVDQLDARIAQLTALGDVVLDHAAYPPPRAQGAGSAAYTGLGGEAYGYNTGFAIKWNYDHLLHREFGRQRSAYVVQTGPWSSEVRGQVVLEAHDIARLRATETIEKRLEGAGPQDFAQPVTSRHVVDWTELNARYQRIVDRLDKLGNEGERLWWERVNGADKAKAASAIRLLHADLGKIVEEWDDEKVSLELRKLIIAKAKDLLLTAPAFLKPFTGVIDFYFDRLIQERSRDLRDKFRETLDDAAIRVAVALAKPAVTQVFPKREEDIRAAIQPKPGLPSSCATAVPLVLSLSRVNYEVVKSPDSCHSRNSIAGTVMKRDTFSGTGSVPVSYSAPGVTVSGTVEFAVPASFTAASGLEYSIAANGQWSYAESPGVRIGVYISGPAYSSPAYAKDVKHAKSGERIISAAATAKGIHWKDDETLLDYHFILGAKEASLFSICVAFLGGPTHTVIIQAYYTRSGG